MTDSGSFAAASMQDTLPPTDPEALAQQLKSQLLANDKALSKNQRKKARKKVTKIMQKALGICPRARVGAGGDSHSDGEQPLSSQDTGRCSNRRAVGSTGDAIHACTIGPHIVKPSSHASWPEKALSQPISMRETVAADASDATETVRLPAPKRRRLDSSEHPQNRSSSGDIVLGANGSRRSPSRPEGALHVGRADFRSCDWHDGEAKRVASGAKGVALVAGSSRLTGGGSVENGRGSSAACGNSQRSHGALKRLSRRQARPEDLLAADDHDGTTVTTVDPSHVVGGSKAGRGNAIAGMVAAGEKRGRRRRGQKREKCRKSSGGGGADVATTASEEVLQIPPKAAMSASAAAVAATAMHRAYAIHGSSNGAAMAAAMATVAQIRHGSAALPQVPVHAFGMAATAGHGVAAKGSMDLSAALLIMRVQLRSSGDKENPGVMAGPVPVATDFASGADGSIVALTATATAAAAVAESEDMVTGGSSVLFAGLDGQGLAAAAATAGPHGLLEAAKFAKHQQRQPRSKAQRTEQEAADRASRYRYGNYHRYYGYRLSADLDEDPRVKLMQREWFEQRVCIDVGCNEGLVTLAVAARFGAKRMTGYDIDGTLIKKACRNLRIMRTEYTNRLRSIPLGRSTGGCGSEFGLGAGSKEGHGSGDDGVDEPAAGATVAPREGTVECQGVNGDENQVGAGEAMQIPDGLEADGNQDEEMPDAKGLAAGGVDGAVAADLSGDDSESNHVYHQLPDPSPHQHQHQQAPASHPPRRGPHSAAGPPPLRVGLLRSHVKSLAGTHFVQQDWANARGRPESADTIMCLSVTKWVHLNNGDAGLKKLFRKFLDTLTPGGLLILEPQPWKSYNRAIHKTTTNAVPFKRIEQLQLRPQHFVDYLTNQLGFVLESRLHEGEGVGFDRPIYLLRKPRTATADGSS